jgi:ferritin
MKIDRKVEQAFNKQINEELFSAYIYLSMSAYFENENLAGMAYWMRQQAQEEVEHAMRFYKHIYERNGEVKLEAIAKPQLAWKSPLDAFEAAFNHEQKVTKLIHDLVDLTSKQKDKAAALFLNWFVDEQVEEEDQALEIVNKLKMIKDNPNGLLMLDNKLGQRKEE